MSLIKIATGWTLAIYIGFLTVYGQTVFDVDFTVFEESTSFLDGLIGAASIAGDVFGSFIAFATLGGFDSPLPGGMQGFLLGALGILWVITIAYYLRGVPT